MWFRKCSHSVVWVVLGLMGCFPPELGNINVDGGVQSMDKAQFRVAHLSPGAPAVDLCVAPRGSGKFSGPLFSNLGLKEGLKYGEVSRYLTVDAAAYDVRLVSPGASDCNTRLGDVHDVVDLPGLPKGGRATIAALGELSGGFSTPFELKAFIDTKAAANDKAQIRLVHASPGTPAVDVGLKSGTEFTPVFSAVSYSKASPADGGYLATAPLERAALAVRAAGQSTDVLMLKDVTVPAGKAVSVFAIGKLGNAQAPLRALLCLDEETVNHVASCTLAGETEPSASVRIAHLSPDAPAVDVCLATSQSSPNFLGPVLKANGLAGGISYKTVTPYVSLKPSKYFARIVAGGAADCSSAVAGLQDLIPLPDLIPDGSFTIAALGKVSGGANGFQLRVFADERTSPQNHARLRVVHASPGTAAVDVGVGQGLTFTKLFSNVSFSEVETENGFINGYLAFSPFDDGILTARLANQSTDALSVGPKSFKAGDVVTAFAIGVAGNATTPLEILVCSDNGTESKCVVAPKAPDAASIRVAHLSPDAPAVDVCLKAKGQTSWVGPVLKQLGATAGLTYSNVTNYVAVSAGGYDVRIVAPNSADCSKALGGLADATDLPTLSSGANVTIAATGLLSASATNRFKLRAYVDTVGAKAGKVGLRFVHASPDAPSVDLGIGSGASYVPVFLNNAFGSSTSYLERDPINTHTVFAIRPTGTTHVALEKSGFVVNVTQSATLFAIGTLSGSQPLSALLCIDAATSGLLAQCVVAP